MDCITSEEINEFFDATVFKDSEASQKCRQAMIHGMAIASMMVSRCKSMFIRKEDQNMAEKVKDGKEEMIQRIKDCGQYIIDNAAIILGDENYIRDLYLTCNFFDISEAPYISINKDVVPDRFIERVR